jgi:urease accessory protein
MSATDIQRLDRVTEILSPGSWPDALTVDRLRLNFEDRLRRRKRHVAIGGRAFLLDLPAARLLGDGEGLRLSSGGVVLIEALAEPLIEVHANGASLARLAWHLGNRHWPVELGAGFLRLRDEKQTADLLARLGANMVQVQGVFSPEANPGDGAAIHQYGHAHR